MAGLRPSHLVLICLLLTCFAIARIIQLLFFTNFKTEHVTQHHAEIKLTPRGTQSHAAGRIAANLRG